jgi:hypothetical protein
MQFSPWSVFLLDLKKLDDVKVKEKYHVEISNRFAALESLDESFDINNAWESIRKSISAIPTELSRLFYAEKKKYEVWVAPVA